MSLNLDAARAALAAALMPYTVSTTARTPNVSSPCGRATPLRGQLAPADGVRQARGMVQLSLPADTALDLAPDEEVTFGDLPGRRFRVVWAPPPSSLNLSRIYGLDEVR
jgi:hypothetical protein